MSFMDTGERESVKSSKKKMYDAAEKASYVKVPGGVWECF